MRVPGFLKQVTAVHARAQADANKECPRKLAVQGVDLRRRRRQALLGEDGTVRGDTARDARIAKVEDASARCKGLTNDKARGDVRGDHRRRLEARQEA